jgi:hypothetical protein
MIHKKGRIFAAEEIALDLFCLFLKVLASPP